MSAKYIVVGGVYVDTSFTKIAPGETEEVYGPFDSYADAKVKWAERAWRTVDDCHARFTIKEAA